MDGVLWTSSCMDYNAMPLLHFRHYCADFDSYPKYSGLWNYVGSGIPMVPTKMLRIYQITVGGSKQPEQKLRVLQSLESHKFSKRDMMTDTIPHRLRLFPLHSFIEYNEYNTRETKTPPDSYTHGRRPGPHLSSMPGTITHPCCGRDSAKHYEGQPHRESTGLPFWVRRSETVSSTLILF